MFDDDVPISPRLGNSAVSRFDSSKTDHKGNLTQQKIYSK
jgi:hypothetical protein